jgi:Protein of unknown function (DUF1077)
VFTIAQASQALTRTLNRSLRVDP